MKEKEKRRNVIGGGRVEGEVKEGERRREGKVREGVKG